MQIAYGRSRTRRLWNVTTIGCVDPYNVANWLFVSLNKVIALILQLHWHESRDPGIITIDKSSVHRKFADRDLPPFEIGAHYD